VTLILNHVNDDYLQRLESTLLQTIVPVDQEKKVAALLSGEIVAAAVNLIALTAAKAVDSPAKLRGFCDECAKHTRVAIRDLQKRKAVGELDFIQAVHASERH
jgi:hypothetical protein